MTADNRPDANGATPPGGALPSAARRRLFQGLAGGTGVLLSVHAKTALGTGICQSPSGKLSGNQSARPGVGVTCTPGDHPNVWAPKDKAWPSSCGRPSFKSDTTNPYKGNLTLATSKPSSDYRNIAAGDLASEGILLSSVVAGAPAIGLWRAMVCESSLVGSNRALLSYLCAAWINCQRYNTNGGRFPISDIEVKRMATAALSGQFYCPSSMMSCGTAAWAPMQVLSYLQQLMGSQPVVSAYVKKGTNGIW